MKLNNFIIIYLCYINLNDIQFLIIYQEKFPSKFMNHFRYANSKFFSSI